MKLKILQFIAVVFIFVLVFFSGQLFYYKKTASSIANLSKITQATRPHANLQAVIQNGLILRSADKELTVPQKELGTWVETYQRNYTRSQESRLNIGRVEAYLKKISATVNTPPVNARFTISDGKTSEFQAPKSGQILNVPATITSIISGITREERPQAQTVAIPLVLNEVEPDITLEKVNRLGIKELLSRGESDFGGSPNNRKHNLTIGAQRFNGIILQPGEEFSFNKLLGDVDASSGYLPELVIKGGKLIPEYGGGLCQVSTTVFRAAVEAGLPILERHAHALPVKYYNPQGYDATIYPGVSDLRFKNDMPTHILIQSKIVGSKLYFEIYGSKDGRQIVIDGPHSYDVQANGALKAYLTRVVTYANGEEKKDRFNSSYKSPALFPTVRNPLE